MLLNLLTEFTSMAKSEEQIDTDLSDIIATMDIEGVALSKEQIARCRGILSGELDADDEVEKLFEKYRALAAQANDKRNTV